MLIDFRSMVATGEIDVDLCIVGAGAAGITMARSLIGSRLTVCLLESGGLDNEPATQALYRGEAIGAGTDSSLLETRQRSFGGSTAVWGGGCAPMLDRDYAELPAVPRSGWRISKAELAPYYLQARSVCQLHDAVQRGGEAGSAGTDDPLRLNPTRFNYIDGVSSQIHFGEAYRTELQRAPNIRVLLHANLIQLETDPNAAVVQSACIRSLDGREATVRARCFVLACGGIENARLLLLSDATMPKGLGNRHDLVGRYFMDHPCARVGVLTPAETLNGRPAPVLTERGLERLQDFGLSDLAQDEGSLVGARFRLSYHEDSVPHGVQTFRELRRKFRERRSSVGMRGDLAKTLRHAGDIIPAILRSANGRSVVLDNHIECHGFFEQLPNPDSRVLLSGQRDAMGQRMVRLDWQITPMEQRSYVRSALLLQAELAETGVGVLRLEPWLEFDTEISAALNGSCHHLGTTRMAEDPHQGVVDCDEKVHGLDNLYVAGSSTFTNSGCFWPTLTIVAHALRLANHLREKLGRPAR